MPKSSSNNKKQPAEERAKDAPSVLQPDTTGVPYASALKKSECIKQIRAHGLRENRPMLDPRSLDPAKFSAHLIYQEEIRELVPDLALAQLLFDNTGPYPESSVAFRDPELERALFAWMERGILPERRAVFVKNAKKDPFKLHEMMVSTFKVKKSAAQSAARTALANLMGVQEQPAAAWPGFRDGVLQAQLDMENAGSAFADAALVLPITRAFRNTKEFQHEIHDLLKDEATLQATIDRLNGVFTTLAATLTPTTSYFAHGRSDRGGDTRPEASKSAPARRDSAREQCYNFAEFGECRFGDKCRFSHATSATRWRQRRRSKRQRPEQPASNFADVRMSAQPDATYSFHAPTSASAQAVESADPVPTTAHYTEKRLGFGPGAAAVSTGAGLSLAALALTCPEELFKWAKLAVFSLLVFVVAVVFMYPAGQLPALPFGPIVAHAMTTPTTARLREPSATQHAFHATPTPARGQAGDWVFDSGTSRTLTNDPADVRASADPRGLEIHTGGGPVQVQALGTVSIEGTGLSADGLLAEDMPVKLVAAADFDDQGRASLIQNNTVYLFDGSVGPGKPFPAVLATFSRGADRLYRLDADKKETSFGLGKVGARLKGKFPKGPTAPQNFLNRTTPKIRGIGFCSAHVARTFTGDLSDFDVVHNRTHASARTIKDTTGSKGKPCFCDACAQSNVKKTAKSGHPRHATTRPLQVVGTDWLGRRHKKAVTPEGFCTGMLFQCEFTGYGFFVPSRTKEGTAAVDAFKRCRTHMESLAQDKDWTVACLFSDAEQALKKGELSAYCQDHHIQQRFSPPNRHDKNPVERYVQTISNPALAFMIHGSAPPEMWCWATSQAVYVSNRLIRKGKLSPLCALSGSDRHGLSSVRAMFCTAWVRVDNASGGEPKAVKCINLGNSWDTHGSYNLLNLTTKKVIVSADVVFNETEFPYTTAPSVTAAVKRDVLDWTWDLGSAAPLAASAFAPQQPGARAPEQITREVKQVRLTSPAAADVVGAAKKRKVRGRKPATRRSPRLTTAVPPDDPFAGRYADPGQVPPAPGQPDPKHYGRKSKRGWQPSEGNLNSIASYMCSLGDLGQFQYSFHVPAEEEHIGQGQHVHEPLHDYIWSCVTWGNEPAPKGFDQAKKRPDFKRWHAAMEKEITSHRTRGTWTLVPRAEATAAGAKVIPSLWVLKDKMLANGDIQAKGRVVACGSRQQADPSVETFAATAQITTLRVVLSLAAHHDLELRNGDFSVAFLNADALETVYMEQPRGFAERNPRKWVCKLRLGLYGTRTANRGWSALLRKTLLDFGFKRSEADHGLYYMRDRAKPVLLVTHVDDLIYAGEPALWNELVKFIQDRFDFQDLGELEWVLGMHLSRDRRRRTIKLDQERYIQKLAERFFGDDRPHKTKVMTPALHGKVLTKEMNASTPQLVAEMADKPYRALVGSLLFATVCTRPDLSQAVGVLCRFQQNPGAEHWKAAKRALRYAVGTASIGLTFGGGSKTFELAGWCDADYAGDLDTRRSTTGYVFYLCGGVISYKSMLQKAVTLSTCEAEYSAAAQAAREAVWTLALVNEIGKDELPTPVNIHEDNQGTIALSKNPVGHGKNKHIDIKKHFLRELTEKGAIALSYTPTLEQIADIFTKALPQPRFLELRKLLMGV